MRARIRPLRNTSDEARIRSLRSTECCSQNARISSLRPAERENAYPESVSGSAVVLSRRARIQRQTPVSEPPVSKRGAGDGNVEALEALIKSAFGRKGGSSREESLASITDSTPKGRREESSPRLGPDSKRRISAVDFGGLEFVEFEMSLELADRTVVKRIGPRGPWAHLNELAVARLLDHL